MYTWRHAVLNTASSHTYLTHDITQVWSDDIKGSMVVVEPAATSSGSGVDEADTPEALADVEATSVAPGQVSSVALVGKGRGRMRVRACAGLV